jgi:sec-independent protein translocase protein TatC
MATAIRTVGHEERLSIVDHLEELRTRLIVSGVVFAIVFGLCFWQNHALLNFINRPLHKQTEQQVLRGEGPAGATWLAQKAVLEVAKDMQRGLGVLSAPSSGLPTATRGRLAGTIGKLEADVARIPRSPSGINPTTLGPGEPLTATLTVTLYFSLVIALPLILFELYGFLMPAFSPQERRVVMPLLVSVPFLFATGAAFGYLVVLPTAVHFLQNFNASQFNVMVQANQYYKFAATVLLASTGRHSRRRTRRPGHPTPAAPPSPLRAAAVCSGRRIPARRRFYAGARDGSAVLALRGEYPDCVGCCATGDGAGDGIRGRRPTAGPTAHGGFLGSV